MLKIGTRGSHLATTQAGHVRDALSRAGYDAELQVVTTAGDLSQAPVERIGIGVFTSALRDALFRGEVDVAVHSFKDLPTAYEPRAFLAVPVREDTREALIARDGLTLAELERAGVAYRGPRWPFPLAALPVAWFAGVIGPRGLTHPSPAEFNARVLLGALFAAFVVAPYALGPRERGTVLSSATMRTLGRWSYSVFLWHMAVLYFVFPVLGVQVFSGHFLLVYAATALASTAVAYMSYELVEVPGARLVRQATANRLATTKKVEEPA